MANVLAVVSKAIFEAQHRGAKPGDVLPMERYVSANTGLTPLSSGGDLYLVTVRPPDEQLWLVGVLEGPKFGKGEWKAKRSSAPVTDLHAIRGQLRFSNGKGLPTKSGTLGMSLQTPRTLTDDDVRLLRSVLDSRESPAAKPPEGKQPKQAAPSEPAPKQPEPQQPNAPLAQALTQAEQAIDASDRSAALDACLEAWRACRAPELAALIDLVSADAVPSRAVRGQFWGGVPS